eukprot:2600455-Amphidinium_carterae.2
MSTTHLMNHLTAVMMLQLLSMAKPLPIFGNLQLQLDCPQRCLTRCLQPGSETLTLRSSELPHYDGHNLTEDAARLHSTCVSPKCWRLLLQTRALNLR